jgi:lyso-ornithine lipid O-acyltransferase
MALLSTARIEHRNMIVLAFGQILFVARALAIIVSMVFCVTLHYVWRLFRLGSPWPQIFLHSLGWISGLIPRFYGNRLKKNVFYASNHLSWADIPLLSGFSGCTFVAQDGVSKWPVVGWLCRLNNTIFVSREDRLNVGEQIETLRMAMDRKQPVAIFPEGTTHDGKTLGAFKPSLFAVLSPPPPGMMVQPVFISYGIDTEEIAWIGEETAFANVWRLLSRLKPIAARVYFLEPFDPSDFDGRKQIASEVRSRMMAKLDAGGHQPRRV